MFPTKPYDPWSKRQMHALRHARTLDAATASGEHAGCFGWCMFDYPTHKDFGSGDRVCYHGVMDAFRNPKLAAAAYAYSSSTKGEITSVPAARDIIRFLKRTDERKETDEDTENSLVRHYRFVDGPARFFGGGGLPGVAH
jgi:hypothetical protein